MNVYSDFNSSPQITRKTFGSTVIKYADSAARRTHAYWDEKRPVPLLEEEARDYRQKDSLEIVRKNPAYLDSIDRKNNKPNIVSFVLLGQSYNHTRKRLTVYQPPLLEMLNYHPAEGLILNSSVTMTKRPDSGFASRRYFSITPAVRYGFLNKHLNPSLAFVYNWGHKYARRFSVSGGRKVFQYNPGLPVSDRDNTVSTLLYAKLIRKTYEATFVRAGYSSGLGNGFSFTTGFQYQDRRSLDNLSEYTWASHKTSPYPFNYPTEIFNSAMPDNQSFIVTAQLRWQPGTKYMQLPERTVTLGSKYPVVELGITSGIRGVGGSDAQFTKWDMAVQDYLNMKLAGAIRYRIGMGGFLSANSVYAPDYQHFNGVITRFTQDYMRSFQLLPQYLFSNTADFHTDLHIEYNLKGFLTNKVPVLRKMNLYLVTGANAVYIDRSKYYYEMSAGFDNILKQLRIDYVRSWLNGNYYRQGIRIGIPLITNSAGKDDWP